MVVHVYLQNHEVALLLNGIATFEIFIWYEVIKLLANHLFHTVSTLARKKIERIVVQLNATGFHIIDIDIIDSSLVLW